jgi:hypothetical protein
MVRKLLLVCGILSSLLYVATVVLAAMRWEGYSSTSQTVSELIAIDAPTRPLVVPLFIKTSRYAGNSVTLVLRGKRHEGFQSPWSLLYN